MGEQCSPEDALMIAALDVIGSLSEANYRGLRKPNRITRPTVRIDAMIALADAVEAIRPGVVDRMYELIREQQNT